MMKNFFLITFYYYYIVELENQLESAQSRCLTLEMQLENMRKMMQGQHQQSGVPRDQRTPRQSATTLSHHLKQGPSQSKRPSPSPAIKHSLMSSPVKEPPSHSSTLVASRMLERVEESPALEKLNGLEREHVKLSLSQSQAEVSRIFVCFFLAFIFFSKRGLLCIDNDNINFFFKG